MFTPVSRALARALSAVAVLLFVGGLTAVPALAQPEPPTVTTPSGEPTSEAPKPSEPAKPDDDAAKPDLKLTATIGAGPFVPHQVIPIEVTVTNNGDGVAKAVMGDAQSMGTYSVGVEPAGWREFNIYQPGGSYPAAGGTIQPGASEVFVLEARISELDGEEPRLRISVTAENELTAEDNEVVLTVPAVTAGTRGAVGGVVYLDTNDNNAYDAGEGIGEVEIRLFGGEGEKVTRTSYLGRFEFPDLPASQYTVTAPFERVEGWLLESPGEVVVDGTDRSKKLTVRGARPLSDVLTATAEFAAKTYQPNDVATMDITLTNHGQKPLSGIKVTCDNSYQAGHLTDLNWGELGGAGVGLAAGESRVFRASGVVSQESREQGIVFVECGAGDDKRYSAGFPTIYQYAKVPGKTSDLGGVVYQDFNGNNTVDDGEPIPGLRFGLAEWKTGPVVAKTTTDANGVVQFIRLPRGLYVPVVYGPWKVVDPLAQLANPVRYENSFKVKVVPGQGTPDPEGATPTPEPVPPADNGPGSSTGSASGSRSGLASTGVEVFGPVAGGAAAVFAGILALLYSRRLRRTRVEA